MGFKNSAFYKFMSGSTPESKKALSWFQNTFGSLLAKLTGSAMTGAEREASDTSLRNSQILAEEDFQRKKDFYEQYESPQALVRQYSQAGINPMAVFGNGGSVSASGGVGTGSAQASTDSGGSLLQSLIGTFTQMHNMSEQRQLDKFLGSSKLDIDNFNAQTRRIEAQNYGKYLEQLTIGQQQKNDTFYTMFGLEQSKIEADISLKNAQTEYFVQVASSETVRRQLMQSGIELNNVNAAVAAVQKAILAAQSKYSDKYFKAVAEMQEAESSVSQANAGVVGKLSENGLLYHGAAAQIADMIFQAGMDQDIWEGDAFKQAVAGKMTKKDWTQGVLGLLKTLVGAGAVIGAGALRTAGRAVIPPMVWSPDAQRGFYNATGTRYNEPI